MDSAAIEKALQDMHEKFLKANELLEESVNDPSTEPYKSKYKASEIFQEIDRELNTLGDDHRISILVALINYELGVIEYETEELGNCDKHLQKSWEFLKDNASTPECVVLSINVLNQLGILMSGRNELQQACDYLKTAENIYGEYKLSKKPCPLDLPELFLLPNENRVQDWAPLEKSLTLTLYYLAQVYEHLQENESSAKYCHITLKRQMESKDYDPLNWSLNCATLSQYFIAREKFGAARHVLACASHIIDGYETNLKSDMENKDDEKWEIFNRCKADVSRCWAKYALHLLISSRDRLNEETNLARSVETSLHLDDTDDFTKVYRLFKESEVKDFENQITCALATNFDDARTIFLFGIQCLHESKKHYILNDYTYDHVQIIQDNSKLYKFLTAFEECISRKCKMHKRRLDLLQDILKKLNPQYYLALCRQLMIEIAETYSEMMDLKLRLSDCENRAISPHVVKKINFLITKSIEYYKSFIDTLTDIKKELPETFSDDVVRPALIAHFCTGRLYAKMIVPESPEEIEYLKKAVEYYNFVIRYVEKNPQHEPKIKEELAIMKEMAELLPNKIQKILSSTLY